jgi:hypothetical protein
LLLIIANPTALTERRFFALRAARDTFFACDDIDNDAAIVLAAVGAGAMSDAEFAAFAAGKAHALDCMMGTAFCRLGAVAAHADYHGQDYTKRLKKGKY